MEGAGCGVEPEHDADAAAEHGARIRGDLPGDVVESAIGGLATCHQLSPHLVPSLRHFRNTLSISHGPRHALSDSPGDLQRLVGPGHPAARGRIGDTLGARLASKPHGTERNHHHLLRALLGQKGCLLDAEAVGRIAGEFPPPRFAR